jgi:hypothetical protein
MILTSSQRPAARSIASASSTRPWCEPGTHRVHPLAGSNPRRTRPDTLTGSTLAVSGLSPGMHPRGDPGMPLPRRKLRPVAHMSTPANAARCSRHEVCDRAYRAGGRRDSFRASLRVVSASSLTLRSSAPWFQARTTRRGAYSPGNGRFSPLPHSGAPAARAWDCAWTST